MKILHIVEPYGPKRPALCGQLFGADPWLYEYPEYFDFETSEEIVILHERDTLRYLASGALWQGIGLGGHGSAVCVGCVRAVHASTHLSQATVHFQEREKELQRIGVR